MKVDYQKICNRLLENISQRRMRDIIERRFNLLNQLKNREPLESIGKSYGITRERVRQIEENGLSRVEKRMGNEVRGLFQYFFREIKKNGGLIKEEDIFNKLGGSKFSNQIFFLLSLSKQFKRVLGNKEYYTLWRIEERELDLAKKVIKTFRKTLEQRKYLLSLNDFHFSSPKISPEILSSYLEISKIILRNSEGLYGLRDWPEINPRGVRDKALLIFKKEKRPLHFIEVTEFINLIEQNFRTSRPALSQTVHNELIKDPRFVLVGRGTYALKEWGYEPGLVKDVILRVIKEAGKPLAKDKIISEVLKQRLVQPNTVLLNLSNKKLFGRDEKEKYFIRSA